MTDQPRDPAKPFLEHAQQMAETLEALINEVESEYTALRVREEQLRRMISSEAEHFAIRVRAFLEQMQTVNIGMTDIRGKLDGGKPEQKEPTDAGRTDEG